METFVNFAIYWNMAMWIIGALVVTGGLVAALMALYEALFMGWGKKMGGQFRFHLWLYQAMRAWERKGNPRPGAQTMSEREKLETCARELIHFAEQNDYVLTITTHADPFSPLAMGNHHMAHDVRESRERYQSQGGQP